MKDTPSASAKPDGQPAGSRESLVRPRTRGRTADSRGQPARRRRAPYRYFETHGPVSSVLEDIKDAAPGLSDNERVSEWVSEVIELFVAREGWKYVVVQLGESGIAQKKFGSTLKRDLGKQGLLVVVPDISYTQAHVFESEEEAFQQRKNLAGESQENKRGVYLILYGIEDPDRNRGTYTALGTKEAVTGFKEPPDQTGVHHVIERIARRTRIRKPRDSSIKFDPPEGAAAPARRRAVDALKITNRRSPEKPSIFSRLARFARRPRKSAEAPEAQKDAARQDVAQQKKDGAAHKVYSLADLHEEVARKKSRSDPARNNGVSGAETSTAPGTAAGAYTKLAEAEVKPGEAGAPDKAASPVEPKAKAASKTEKPPATEKAPGSSRPSETSRPPGGGPVKTPDVSENYAAFAGPGEEKNPPKEQLSAAGQEKGDARREQETAAHGNQEAARPPAGTPVATTPVATLADSVSSLDEAVQHVGEIRTHVEQQIEGVKQPDREAAENTSRNGEENQGQQNQRGEIIIRRLDKIDGQLANLLVMLKGLAPEAFDKNPILLPEEEPTVMAGIEMEKPEGKAGEISPETTGQVIARAMKSAPRVAEEPPVAYRQEEFAPPESARDPRMGKKRKGATRGRSRAKSRTGTNTQPLPPRASSPDVEEAKKPAPGETA